jgi:hypothetical protein
MNPVDAEALAVLRNRLRVVLDVFVLPNGRRLGIMGDEMYGVSSVAEWQLIQEAPDLFTVCVVPAKGYSPADSEQILKNLGHDLPGVKINIKTVPAIERGPGGKRPLYVSLLSS